MDQLRPFWLVNAANEDQVFAVGLDLGDEAITYRKDPAGKRHFGQHDSAEAALRNYSYYVDIELQWGDELVDALLETLQSHHAEADGGE